MHDLSLVFAGAVVGAVVFALAWGRYWLHLMRDPERAREMLRGIHAKAHPHWLQISETDDRRVCPTCGWTEEKEIAPPTPLAERRHEESHDE